MLVINSNKDVVSEPWRSISHKRPHRSDTSPKPVSGELHGPLRRFGDYTSFWLVNGRGYNGFNSGRSACSRPGTTMRAEIAG
jgi:hypothetical protein